MTRARQSIIAGVDEAGRGPLAGPVVAAAVILSSEYHLPGLADSKRLTPSRREQLFIDIHEQAISVATGFACVAEIDTLNILHASLLAMQRALYGLSVQPTETQIDGNRCPEFPPAFNQAFVGGDGYMPAIMAASIIAKVTRDRVMQALDRTYPHYGFAQHKGYPTKQHLNALAVFGACDVHRKSFGPVRACLGA